MEKSRHAIRVSLGGSSVEGSEAACAAFMKTLPRMTRVPLDEVLGEGHGLGWIVCSGARTLEEARKLAEAFRVEVGRMREELASIEWPAPQDPSK